ncbi:uncharacterized protein LOC102801739 [Saccoglossus kowalevskii]|uniref:Uncharacterized protein LOC102801739 n=1 Tax=Saccoglossus kowalevskii TaxID=10224 RepID=A0ABM0MXD0_SACKO|nr:PREDICTED: uncharacterized protein LOC102801739 [Saccoglossus kowalevskii]
MEMMACASSDIPHYEHCLNGVRNNSIKRKRTAEDETDSWTSNNTPLSHFRGRKFIPLKGGSAVFHSEDVKNKEETLYLPLQDDILLNTNSMEQISFNQGSYFIGDEMGTYVKSENGYVVNLWRYDGDQRRLYIARSLLFTNLQTFIEIKTVLENI